MSRRLLGRICLVRIDLHRGSGLGCLRMMISRIGLFACGLKTGFRSSTLLTGVVLKLSICQRFLVIIFLNCRLIGPDLPIYIIILYIIILYYNYIISSIYLIIMCIGGG